MGPYKLAHTPSQHERRVLASKKLANLFYFVHDVLLRCREATIWWPDAGDPGAGSAQRCGEEALDDGHNHIVEKAEMCGRP